MGASPHRAPRSAYVAFTAICLLWGTTYFAIKIALEAVPPLLIGGIRYIIAGGLLVAWLRWRGESFPARAGWPTFPILGALMLLLGNGGVVWAEQYVPSGLAAVVIATCPFWMVGVESLFPGGQPLSGRLWIGLLVGFAGIVVLVWPDVVSGEGRIDARFVGGLVALQVACAGWAVGSSYGLRHRSGSSPFVAASLQMLWGGVWLTLTGTFTGEWHHLHFTARSMTALLYLTFAGGLAGFVAYIYALSHLPVSFVSLYAYVNPVIAVGLGALFLEEPFGLRVVGAVALILIGVAVVPSQPH